MTSARAPHPQVSIIKLNIKSGNISDLTLLFSPAATASHGSSNTVKRRPEAGGARVTRPRHLKQKKDAGYKTGTNGESHMSFILLDLVEDIDQDH